MNDKQARWLALYVLCLGDLMIVLDTNIVNVALPSIQADLGFSQTALAWVVNAYMLTFGGFLLLSGRLETSSATNGSSWLVWSRSPPLASRAGSLRTRSSSSSAAPSRAWVALRYPRLHSP